MTTISSSDTAVKVDIYSMGYEAQFAWATVNDNGIVTFLDPEGDTTSCMLDNGLKVGSKCSISSALAAHTTLKSGATSFWSSVLSQTSVAITASPTTSPTRSPKQSSAPTTASTNTCSCAATAG
ncbi:hypothetical protein N7456_006858 [Penicillium angulare]|uniref:Uncharacterized protein n=1 Tax=Penicillium angulare TaxID=116970 RepID=A0A9W9FIF2_9EURO|nr:hypothetical protein N7456_006858 [Penicillium angulare]